MAKTIKPIRAWGVLDAGRLSGYADSIRYLAKVRARNIDGQVVRVEIRVVAPRRKGKAKGAGK